MTVSLSQDYPDRRSVVNPPFRLNWPLIARSNPYPEPLPDWLAGGQVYPERVSLEPLAADPTRAALAAAAAGGWPRVALSAVRLSGFADLYLSALMREDGTVISTSVYAVPAAGGVAGLLGAGSPPPPACGRLRPGNRPLANVRRLCRVGSGLAALTYRADPGVWGGPAPGPAAHLAGWTFHRGVPAFDNRHHVDLTDFGTY